MYCGTPEFQNFAKENIRNTPNETSLAREAAIGNLGPFTRNLQVCDFFTSIFAGINLQE